MKEKKQEFCYILETRPAFLQESARILRVVDRIARGLYTLRTEEVLPTTWPMRSVMMDGSKSYHLIEKLESSFREMGNRTFLFAPKHLKGESRQALFWMVFYESVHFWTTIGEKMMPFIENETDESCL